MTFKSGRGGTRPGAGRPKSNIEKKSATFYLPVYILTMLKVEKQSASRIITLALAEWFKNKK